MPILKDFYAFPDECCKAEFNKTAGTASLQCSAYHIKNIKLIKDQLKKMIILNIKSFTISAKGF